MMTGIPFVVANASMFGLIPKIVVLAERSVLLALFASMAFVSVMKKEALFVRVVVPIFSLTSQTVVPVESDVPLIHIATMDTVFVLTIRNWSVIIDVSMCCLIREIAVIVALDASLMPFVAMVFVNATLVMTNVEILV